MGKGPLNRAKGRFSGRYTDPDDEAMVIARADDPVIKTSRVPGNYRPTFNRS